MATTAAGPIVPQSWLVGESPPNAKSSFRSPFSQLPVALVCATAPVPSKDQRFGMLGVPSLHDRAALLSTQDTAQDSARSDGIYNFLNRKGPLAMHKQLVGLRASPRISAFGQIGPGDLGVIHSEFAFHDGLESPTPPPPNGNPLLEGISDGRKVGSIVLG